MNKALISTAIFVLAACTPMIKREDNDKNDRYPAHKKSAYMVDMCEQENMPKLNAMRPKLTSRELKNLTEEQMDQRIQQHIGTMESYIDGMEKALSQTRHRVELCR